jgi:hypothetical protein
MMSKDEFVSILKRGGSEIDGSEPEFRNFDAVARLALSVQAAMPGIGFCSASRRINCFVAVCRHLDALIDAREIDLTQSQFVISLLRIKNKAFRKATVMFDFHAPQWGVEAKAALPRAAREYLAGLTWTRRG